MKNIFFVLAAVWLLAWCGAKVEVVYDLSLDEAVALAKEQGRDASALAERLGQYTDPRYLACYADILGQAKYIANPGYKPGDEPMLILPEEIKLAYCTVGTPRNFDIEISNNGAIPLQINDIQLSCTCLELLTDKTLTLAPGATATVRVAFTAESAGEFYREVMFFSNAAEKLMRVPIRATAKS